MSQSAGIVSTDVLITVKSGLLALTLFRNFVAPIAEEPMPASQANTTFFTPSAEVIATGAAVPLACAFLLAISSWASSRLLPLDIRTIAEDTTKDIAVAITTPIIIWNILSPGAIIR